MTVIQCNKMAFLTRKQAKRRARRATFRLYPYRCPQCELWHLTSADAERRVHFRENAA